MGTSKLRDAILAHYLDGELMVTKDCNPTHWSSGNSPLSTGQFYLMLLARREADIGDIERFTNATNGLVVDGNRGLYARNRGRADLNSHDNYIGIAAASALLDTKHRFDIYSWGKRHLWSFNNQVIPFSWINYQTWARNRWSAWHGRFPSVVAFYRLCAGDELGWASELALGRWIELDSLTGSFDSHLLTWVMVQVCRAKGVCVEACDIWEKHIHDKHGCIGTVFGEVYGFTHPFFEFNF